jgi:hypothetical protein
MSTATLHTALHKAKMAVHKVTLAKETAARASNDLQNLLRAALAEAGPCERFDVLRSGFAAYVAHCHKNRGVKLHAHGLADMMVFSWASPYATTKSPVPFESFEEVVSFVSEYRSRCAKWYTLLDDVGTGRGDDSYGDLIDVLPLLPPEVLACLESDPSKFTAWETNFSTDYPWVFFGEWYMRSTLLDALERVMVVYQDQIDTTEYPVFEVSFKEEAVGRVLIAAPDKETLEDVLKRSTVKVEAVSLTLPGTTRNVSVVRTNRDSIAFSPPTYVIESTSTGSEAGA